VGPRSILDAVVKKKIPSPCQESNPRTPFVQPVAQRYTESLDVETRLFSYVVILSRLNRLN